MIRARAFASWWAVIALISGGTAVPASGQQQIRLSPSESYPLAEITIAGLPPEAVGLDLQAIPLDDQGRRAGDGIVVVAVQLEEDAPVFIAPPHPAGLDRGGRFRIDPEDRSVGEPLFLTIRPLPAPEGQTAGFIQDLIGFVETIAVAGVGDPGRLRSGPIDEVPLHLLGAALSLRALERATDLPASELAWADRWLATGSEAGAVEEVVARLADLPRPPARVVGGDAEGAERKSSAHPGSTEVALASLLPRFAPTPSVVAARPPWEKVEICSQCPGALDYWMTLQAELELGYGNLAERMKRDRDLFEFLNSLEGPAPDRRTVATKKALTEWRKKAKKQAKGTFDDLLTPAAKSGKAIAEAVLAVARFTIGVNDKFLVALLPSELLPSSVAADPGQFNEDDKRAEPEDPGAGDWHMRVTARSSQVEFTAAELFGYFRQLKTILGKAESGVFGEADEDHRSGICVPGGQVHEDTEAGVGESACELVGDVIDETSKNLKKYNRARQALGDAGPDLSEVEFEPLTLGPFVWLGIDVSDPRWSAARALGECVRVMRAAPAGTGGPWQDISYSPADPVGSWGFIADHESSPRFGFKPAAVGGCDLRLSTRVDRFGDAAPVHVDVPVRVDEIRVLVNPNPITVEPGKERTFEATVRNVDSLDVGWSPSSGSGQDVGCESEGSGRPCYRWEAPALEQGECRRQVRITAESLASRGLRASGEPPRTGFAAVEVVDPAADLQITRYGTPVGAVALDPEEKLPLEATGLAADQGDIVWLTTGGSFSPGTGSSTIYHAPREAGTYRITASNPGSENCAPSLLVTVVGGTNEFHFAVGGAATGQQNGWIWVATEKPPSMYPESDLCHVAIKFVPSSVGTGLAGMQALPLLSLTIGVRDGLRARPYPVGTDETRGYGWIAREENPETFFATLGARLANPASELSALSPGGHFWSTGGSVNIDYIDSTRIQGSFNVNVRALEPLDGSEQFQFIEATVNGSFSGPLAPDSQQRERLARINRPHEDVYNCQPTDGLHR